jgi:ABC-type dipeptide/oligopeptide/nickel transport system permease component
MGIDIRLPVGILFVLLGLILGAYGAFGDPTRYQQSLGVNINLYWGMALFAFGLMMLLLARRGARRESVAESVEPVKAVKTAETASRSPNPSGH